MTDSTDEGRGDARKDCGGGTVVRYGGVEAVVFRSRAEAVASARTVVADDGSDTYPLR